MSTLINVTRIHTKNIWKIHSWYNNTGFPQTLGTKTKLGDVSIGYYMVPIFIYRVNFIFWSSTTYDRSTTHPKFDPTRVQLMTSGSWQYISCQWDACSNHLAISDFTFYSTLDSIAQQEIFSMLVVDIQILGLGQLINFCKYFFWRGHWRIVPNAPNPFLLNKICLNQLINLIVNFYKLTGKLINSTTYM